MKISFDLRAKPKVVLYWAGKGVAFLLSSFVQKSGRAGIESHGLSKHLSLPCHRGVCVHTQYCFHREETPSGL